MNAASIRDTRQVLRESLDAVQGAAIRSLSWRGWDQLQERNAEGNVTGVRPYTQEAIDTFRTAYQSDFTNIQLVHHLAIAVHAQAWDLELEQDPRAADLWKEALGYWRELVAAPRFWDGLKAKYRELDPNGDKDGSGAAWIDQVRRSLLEDLLDIHVEFVRYWTEKGEHDQCQAHLDIIRSAALPPAVKRQFAHKVYGILTAGVPDACAIQEYSSAMTSLERYLVLFPDHLPALRQTAEVCKDWLEYQLTYHEHWDDIYALSGRIKAWMTAFTQHPDLDLDPLSKPKIEALALQFTWHGFNRGRRFGSKDKETNQLESAEKGKASYQFALEWARMGLPYCPSGSTLQSLICSSLNNMAVLLSDEVPEIRRSSAPAKTRYRAIRRIYIQTIEYIDEAIEIGGETDLYVSNREIFQNGLVDAEMELSRLGA